MICFRCQNETDFEVKEVDVEQEYKNTIVTVKTPLTICKCCGWQCLDLGQLNELLKRTKAEFDKLFC